MNWLAKYTDYSYAALRIISGAIFLFHGVQKIFGFLAEHQPSVGSQLWIGGMIELICGLAIAIGFRVRWAALPFSTLPVVAAGSGQSISLFDLRS